MVKKKNENSEKVIAIIGKKENENSANHSVDHIKKNKNILHIYSSRSYHTRTRRTQKTSHNIKRKKKEGRKKYLYKKWKNHNLPALS